MIDPFNHLLAPSRRADVLRFVLYFGGFVALITWFKYVDVYQFPDGRIEVRAGGVSIPYHTYDKLGEIDQGAIVENKRLGHALRISSVIQANRDNRRAAPSTAHRSNGKLVQYKELPGTKRSRDFSEKDLRRALENQQ